MGNKVINSFVREGGWNSAYSAHYEAAWSSYYDYENVLINLKLEEQRLLNENGDFPKEHLSSFIHHETAHLHSEAYRFATSAHLFVCMAIEGFLNYYGTVRLGEVVYKRILERVGVTEKLSLIYLMCFEDEVGANDGLYKDIRRIFDQRNALVHPKTKEVTSSNTEQFNYIHPEDLPLAEAFEVLEKFVGDICARDTDIHRGFHFKKPNKALHPTKNRDAVFVG